MARKSRKQPEQPRTDKYTLDRFFGHCSAESRQWLTKQWNENNILVVNKLKRDMLCCSVLMAAYGLANGYELVDDYELLLSRTQEELRHYGSINHYDLFAVSSCIINFMNFREPTTEALDVIGMRNIWTQLMGFEP